jgi:membrane protein
MGTATAERRRGRPSNDLHPRAIARDIADAFREHDLLTYAAAIAFQMMVSLIPLTMLTIALLGRLGLGDVWKDTMAPALESRLSKPLFQAVNHSVTSIVSSPDAGLIAFAAALSLWYTSRAVRAVVEALNRIHDVEDRRPLWKRLLVAVGLATLICSCVVAAALVIVAAPRAGGAADVVLSLGRWLVVGVVLLGLVGIIVRTAPAEHPEPRWASLGSVAIVVTSLVATLLFRLWIDYVADFKSPTGALTTLLLLTGYFFVLSAVFLVCVELDELLRVKTRGRARSALEIVRAAWR